MDNGYFTTLRANESVYRHYAAWIKSSGVIGQHRGLATDNRGNAE